MDVCIMSRLQAEQAAKHMIMSGYRHHTFEDERCVNHLLFSMKREELVTFLYAPGTDELLLRYADVLGPTRLRSIRNSFICLITQICRNAIDFGVDTEFSFALSDYYINLLETKDREKELLELAKQIYLHYFDLIQMKKQQQYSKPIASAVRYIGRNLYDTCQVSAVAAYAGLEQHYFSTLFTKQVGISPAKYILACKLDEGRRMLSQLDITVTEVAESLGFYDVAHFSRRFKEAYGLPPSQAARRDTPRKASSLPL